MNIFHTVPPSLPKKFKKNSYIFILFSIIAVFLETFSLGLIFPLMEGLINGNFTKNLLGINFIELQKNYNDQNIIEWLMFLIIILFFFKTIFLIFFNYWKLKFSSSIYKQLSTDLFSKYLASPISFFYKKNSSTLFRNTYLETKNYGTAIRLYLDIVSESLIFIFIFGLIVYIEPLVTIVVTIILLFFIILFYLLTSKKLYNFGEKQLNLSQKTIQVLNESFQGIRDIKLKSSEIFFYQYCKKYLSELIKVINYRQAIVDAPRIFFELLIIVIFFGVFIIFLNNENSISNIIPIIGLYTFAVFKLMPIVTKLLNVFQTLKSVQPSIKVIQKEFEEIESLKKAQSYQNQKNILFENNIKFENVSFSYDQKRYVLENFSYEIKKNSIIGLTGRSGSGKSTLIDILTGLQIPNKGKIKIDNIFLEENIYNWQKKIGYVSQNVFLFDKSLRENIAFGQENDKIDDKKISNILRKTALLDVITDLNVEVGEKGIKFSGGQVQRMGIARELYRDPELLILDEATNSLDKQTENLILESIKDLKKSTTIIIISHKESTLKICDEIINLEKI